MCLIGLESIVDVDDNGVPRPGSGYNEPVKITNLPIGGKTYSISFRDGKSEMTVSP
jgi:hypothetical protein